ncbi:type IV pilin-like G/H family protein [Microcoleus sp. Pol14C6]|uniref:type IV pilin-like G/H family protein n=1 Tax=unclassified Microcoleus TaxID=2642155 RepID=UPI002FCECFE7
MTKNQASMVSKFTKGCCRFLLLIIGITLIDATALPSFLNQREKAKQAEAKQYVRSMNKAQQVDFLERGSFSNSVEALGIGIKTETTNYKYSIRATNQAVFNYGVSKQELKSCIGAVFVVPAKEVDAKAAKDKMTTASILCQADSAGTRKPAEPTYENGKIACGTDTTQVTK